MKALSIHQPWAWAILHAGKNVENRTWPTRHRGPLFIHASKSKASYDAQDAADWRKRFGVALPPWDKLTTGAIIGVVEVVGCDELGPTFHQVHGGPAANWYQGPWCWLLASPRAFEKPIPFRGMQGLFEVPDSILEIV